MSGIAEEASFYEQSMIDVSSRQVPTYHPTSQTIQSAINVESEDEEGSDEEESLQHSNVFVYSTIDVRSNPPTSSTLTQQVNSPKYSSSFVGAHESSELKDHAWHEDQLNTSDRLKRQEPLLEKTR